ncbi:hypothetical protein [Proteiniclasticum sp.]|uniref:hypothetical protein n=1 Tax=Proteiniclasticum sp. TaxID=2053595 RepID=UPI0028A0D4C2|nr:hypothetical protein [Proteiniclasticum sp.]
MKALLYAIIGIGSTIWMNDTQEQKNKKGRLIKLLLSSILIFISMFLFINEVSEIDFTKYMNLQ